MFIGRVNNKSSGLINTLARPMINIAISASEKYLILIPGIIWETINRARAFTNHLMMRFMSLLYTSLPSEVNPGMTTDS